MRIRAISFFTSVPVERASPQDPVQPASKVAVGWTPPGGLAARGSAASHVPACAAPQQALELPAAMPAVPAMPASLPWPTAMPSGASAGKPPSKDKARRKSKGKGKGKGKRR